MVKLERVIKALANRRRLAIVAYLKTKKEAPVWEIADHIGLSFKATSKHLGVLAAVDIVEREQRSLEKMFYHLEKPQPEGAKQILPLL
ncbi:TPA: hypothetical protein DDZ10_04080 [Candidatus Uhrbacteria bacterium]|uniref:HTH arsR-type domain-containing protein n=1 Tax=Candidatus Uhrbacteria bacterium GW2011_GWC2_53_7 TaxID=1618986 RepID=A0A0G1XZV7_9BACT|nr:MAG: hypothetical protein UY82_C0022G0003 [Candidatus Uhrbacteria bacterium GW2011_GWC2_53_7]OGL71466.1 MAG: hypothetical protein A3D69_00405 [Candidatus Uhrbacteria bacterium RIFCSPHIGHO2_02_FULL_54_11]HBL39817.1 hypothetical protein [Candidatus Uhrbacteria bacterium]